MELVWEIALVLANAQGLIQKGPIQKNRAAATSG
jgi:hypothetical protein